MIQMLSEIAQRVARSIDNRKWDQHRVFNEALVNHSFVHQLINLAPECESRLWIGFRPWPDESTESIGYWIDADSDQSSMAIEIHIDDPRDNSPRESAAVWGKIISDVMRLATAIAHCQLGNGFVVLFGELRHDENDQRISQFPMATIGETRLIETRKLSSDTVMDEAFFEEIMHPHELVPVQVELQLAAGEQIDIGSYTQLTNTWLGLARTLGLERKSRPVRRLHEHLAEAS